MMTMVVMVTWGGTPGIVNTSICATHRCIGASSRSELLAYVHIKRLSLRTRFHHYQYYLSTVHHAPLARAPAFLPTVFSARPRSSAAGTQ